MNRESVADEDTSHNQTKPMPDVYGPLQRTLAIGDAKRRLVMRRPMNRISETLLNARAHTVLDVGCGTGVLARQLSDCGLQITGIDSSRTMIRRAQSVAPGIRLQWADATSFVHERVFDAAVISMALHEVSPDARIKLWNNTLRAVKAGGLILALDFVEPSSDSLFSRIVRAQIERDERSFDRVNPSHYTNYRQFMAAGGLVAWLREVDATIESDDWFLGTNLGLFRLRKCGRFH